MKLLLDENLSPRLPAMLADLYPDSSQIELLGLRGSADTAVWDYAKAHDFVLVSKDNDFRQRSFQYGAPPKVAWISVASCGARRSIIRRRSCCARAPSRLGYSTCESPETSAWKRKPKPCCNPATGYSTTSMDKASSLTPFTMVTCVPFSVPGL